MPHNIRDFGEYRGIPIYRDSNIGDNEQVYIGNGQGCGTFWFKTVEEARKFIDKHGKKSKVTDFGSVQGLIPLKLCLGCTGNYPHNSKKWRNAKDRNCSAYKEELKKQAEEHRHEFDQLDYDSGDYAEYGHCKVCGCWIDTATGENETQRF